MTFQIGQRVVTRSSGIAHTVLEIIDTDMVWTTCGDSRRRFKVQNLCTPEEYRAIWERREAKRRKKFGRR